MDYFTEFRSEGFEQQKLYRMPERAKLRASSLPFINQCIVSDVGYYPRAEGHLVGRPEGIDAHVLIFCVSGRGWYSTGNTPDSTENRREVSSGKVVYFRPYEAHSYGAHSSDPWEIYWIHVTGDGVAELLEWCPFSKQRRLERFSNKQALRRQFNTMLQRLEGGYTDHCLLEMSRFLMAIVSLLHCDGGSQRQRMQRGAIERAMDEMRASLADGYDLDHYARFASLSVSQFCHLFKKNYGTSPMAYLTELRMQKARELLESTTFAIKEISERLGYQDPLYFSRQFKKVSGVSPLQYRSEDREFIEIDEGDS